MTDPLLAGFISATSLAGFSRQPLSGDKIFWNLVVGLVLGILTPIFSG